LNKIEEAFKIAEKEKSTMKWKQVGDIALISGIIDMAISCFEACDDLSGLLLIYSSLGLKERMRKLAKRAEELTRTNIAFACYFQLCEIDACVDVLVKSKRIPEAAFFSKTYCPSKITKLVQQWREDLQRSHPIASQKIADPMEHLDQFEDLITLQKIEEFIYAKRKDLSVPAHQFNEFNTLLSQDFFSSLKQDPDFDLSSLSIVPPEESTNPLIEKFKNLENEDEVEVDNVENVENAGNADDLE